MRITITLFALAVSVSGFSQAQTKALHEEKDKVQVLSVKLGSNEGPTYAACDKKGDVFFTVWDSEKEDPADRPLLMFDTSGRLKTQFASSRKELQLSQYEDHFEPSALLPGGGVTRLVWTRDVVSLTVFSAEGKLESRTKLDPPFFLPNQIAVFPSGELLVSGIEPSHKRNEGSYKSFSAIYDKNGHLQKRLSLAEDIEIDRAAEVGDSRYTFRGPASGNHSVSGGRTRLGDDGNAYVMRRTSPAIVYVISSSGDLLRTLTIEPADTGQMPGEMQVAGGRVAVQFWTSCSDGPCEHTERNITVVDATTGQKLASYENENVQGEFVCYNAQPERFRFLQWTDDNKLQLVDAVAK